MLPSICKRNLYFSLVYSYLIYGLEVYGLCHKSVLKPLMVTCNRALRALQDKPRDYPTNLLYSNYNTLPINLLFKFVVLNLVYRCLNSTGSNRIPSVICNLFTLNRNVHNYNTRSHNNLHLSHNFSSSLGSCVYLGASLWNDLPETIRNCSSAAVFKKKLKFHLSHYTL